MKLYKILFESFVHEPRNLKLFMSNLSKEIRKREEKIISLAKNFDFTTDEKADKEDKEYYFSKFLNMATNYNYDRDDIEYVLRNLQYAINKHGNNHLADNIDRLFEFAMNAKNNYDKYQMLSYIVQSLNYFTEDLLKYLEPQKKIAKYDYSEALEEYREYIDENISEKLKQFGNEYVNFYEYINDYVLPKLSRLMQRRHAGTDEDMAQKTIEPIETLYHTTVNATELFKTGFKTDYKQSVEGLGGSNVDKSGKSAISFTSDLYVAKEILRCLKEAIMIAKGELDIYDIKTMALQAGVAAEIEKGFPFFSKEENLKDLHPETTFDYYRYYLAFSNRYDPVFFDSGNLMKLFKNKNIEDAGILVCKVNMLDPNIKYLNSMEEYRISPKNIISIEKILK